MLTYGDGVGDVPLDNLLDFHRTKGGMVTLTSVQPSGRFGLLDFFPDRPERVRCFQEKIKGDGGWINAGFFVVEPQFLDYLEADSTILEREPLERAAREGKLTAFRHEGFWQPMDTVRD